MQNLNNLEDNRYWISLYTGKIQFPFLSDHKKAIKVSKFCFRLGRIFRTLNAIKINA